MIRWRAPDLTADERATLDSLDVALEAEAMYGTWTCEDRREWERMLEGAGRRRGEYREPPAAKGGAS